MLWDPASVLGWWGKPEYWEKKTHTFGKQTYTFCHTRICQSWYVLITWKHGYKWRHSDGKITAIWTRKNIFTGFNLARSDIYIVFVWYTLLHSCLQMESKWRPNDGVSCIRVLQMESKWRPNDDVSCIHVWKWVKMMSLHYVKRKQQ